MSDTIIWNVAPLASLSALDVHDLLRLRTDVFVVEQQCIYSEIDGHDPQALHVLGRTSDEVLAAYARILPPHDDGLPHIGRVVVDPTQRGTGLGHKLMVRILQALVDHYGATRSALAAQKHLQHFYGAHGYVRVSDEYLWDGIMHVDMHRGA